MGGVTRLLLLLWAAVTVSSALDLQKRIIWGGRCRDTERRYHVKLIDDKGYFFCGGSLISDQWILTAAHCWKWGMRAVVNVHPPHPPPYQAVLITTPPEIYADNNDRMHDIMLLRLPNPLQGQVNIILLPTAQHCANQPNVVRIAGFGPTNVCLPSRRKDNDEPDELQCADIPVVNCQNFRNNALNTPANNLFRQSDGHHHWICAQSPNNQPIRVDTAPGDSGGGVESNGRIRGVISAGGGLAFDQPALFMDVCRYMHWIRATTGIQP